MFRTDSRTVRAMTFEKASKPIHRFIAKVPIQSCAKCTPSSPEPHLILRSQLQGWRITCAVCGEWLSNGTNTGGGEEIAQYCDTALRGEKLLHDEAEGGTPSWGSPIEIVRLMLIRRIFWPLLREEDRLRYRVLPTIQPF